MTSIPHKPAKPTVETPGPRRPEPTWQEILAMQEVLAIADDLLARDRAQLSRLSSAGRLRRWGRR